MKISSKEGQCCQVRKRGEPNKINCDLPMVCRNSTFELDIETLGEYEPLAKRDNCCASVAIVDIGIYKKHSVRSADSSLRGVSFELGSWSG
jgi:hypothetical protein